MLICTGLGDVVADGVGLAGVNHTAGTAFTFRHHSELTVHRRAGQRPAVYLPLQALALLAVLHPGVPTTEGEKSILVEALAAETRITLRTAKQVGRRTVTVTDHPPTHHLASLTGADGAPIIVEDPDLPIVFDLVVVDTVPGAVVSVRAAAVVAPLQVETHRVIRTGVPARLTFINVDTGLPIG